VNAPANLPLADCLRDEYERMIVRTKQARDRAARLRTLAEQAAEQVESDERLLRSLAEVLGLSAQSTIEDLGGALRGIRLRKVAIEILKQHRQPGDEIHYRDWYTLVADEGRAIAGKDPLATFLAQVSRSEAVEAVGRRTGRYRLVAIA
jgi:hypothetical protein